MGQARRRGTRDERIDNLRGAFGVVPMMRQRFEVYVSWTRSPIAGFVTQELECFSDVAETVLGALALDNTDRDFGFVTLGRDEKGRFRCIDVGVDFEVKSNARIALFKSIKANSDSGLKMFAQGDADKSGIDLFVPIVPEDKQHQSFKVVSSLLNHSPARAVLSEMMRHFVDVDGNFVQQFQSGGFDARIWELYLYAYFLEERLFTERPTPAPDYCVSRGYEKVFIEAVTVNATAGEEILPIAGAKPQFRSGEEVAEILKGKMPIKFGSALFSKLNRKTPYWSLQNVANNPFVLAIADFHEPQSMTWSSPALFQYLYGVSHDFHHDEHGRLVISTLNVETHEYNGKTIPSGFFYLPNAENISAVLFTASGTIAKFDRIGRYAGFGAKNLKILRYGLCHDDDPNASLPKRFVFDVEPGAKVETWGEGLSMFHNPNALHPVSPDLFPSIAHHWFEDGDIRSVLPEFHPYSSMTMNIHIRDE